VSHLAEGDQAPMLLTIDIDSRSPSDACAAILEAWRSCLVLHIRARGVEAEHARAFYERILPKIGTPHLLAEDVKVGDRNSQRSGELWMEVRYVPGVDDAYRHSSNAQPLHTDGSYIPSFPNATLMCCVRNAGEGGETTFIDGRELVSALQTEDRALLSLLQTVPMPHERSGDRRIHPVIRYENGELRLNWNYYCVSPEAPSEALKLREQFFNFLKSSPSVARATVPVKLASGDAVTWKDEAVLHGRNAFKANVASERFLWKCAVNIGVFEHMARPT
jgi:alpha-ketoglutarate-dependent taurine dioxygenase